MTETRRCKCGCGTNINLMHPNAKFVNQRHKDKYHNWNNPRGKFAHLADYDPGDSEYWDRK